MKANTLMVIAAVAMTMGPLGSLAAAPKPKADIGKTEFMEKCASCHGRDARGTGGITDLLSKAPADLTILAKRNGGVFPYARVYDMMDGRDWVRTHGNRDMPQWGSVYTTETLRAAEYYVDTPYDMELFARARLLSLVDYLYRVQAK